MHGDPWRGGEKHSITSFAPHNCGMPQNNNHVRTDARPGEQLGGELSAVPPPFPEDHHVNSGIKPVSNAGCEGPVPSKKGGDSEYDFMNKPPYNWKSGSDKFVPKYATWVLATSQDPTSSQTIVSPNGECWCGSVAFEIRGDPVDAKPCHCRWCLYLRGAPFQWAVIFPEVSMYA